jgi:hypothetical protein
LLALVVTLFRLAVIGPMAEVILEYRVPRGGEFLLMVQWVLLFKRRGVREYALICLVGAVLLACAALLVPQLRFALVFLGYLVAAMCMMSLAQECHERARIRAGAAGALAAPALYRLNRRFVLRRVAGALALLVPTAALFVAMPRPGAEREAVAAALIGRPVAPAKSPRCAPILTG